MTTPVRRTRPAPRLAVVVVGTRKPLAASGLGRWLATAAPRTARGTVTIALVADREMARLNGQFRGKHAATDVLSFPADGTSQGSGRKPRLAHRRGAGESGHRGSLSLRDKSNRENSLGDIAIARGVALRQARAEGHSLGTELRVLALHGILHLLGYDHDRDRGEMKTLETRLRLRAGLPAGLIERAPRRPRHR